jgi:1-acyl-sn-glycerol-3-phosphate acyltransferase
MLGTTKLLWDPFLSHIMLRLPYHFVEQTPKDPAADLVAIAEMCSTMNDDSVMIIFPEGGNWTPGRRDRAIESLVETGRQEQADRAARMTNVLPPRSAGAAAALQAREDVTVVFVVHAGLGDLYSFGQLWRNVPLRRKVQAAYWSVPSNEIPVDRSELGAWLFDRWAEVDKWIDDNRPASLPPSEQLPG